MPTQTCETLKVIRADHKEPITINKEDFDEKVHKLFVEGPASAPAKAAQPPSPAKATPVAAAPVEPAPDAPAAPGWGQP